MYTVVNLAKDNYSFYFCFNLGSFIRSKIVKKGSSSSMNVRLPRYVKILKSQVHMLNLLRFKFLVKKKVYCVGKPEVCYIKEKRC